MPGYLAFAVVAVTGPVGVTLLTWIARRAGPAAVVEPVEGREAA